MLAPYTGTLSDGSGRKADASGIRLRRLFTMSVGMRSDVNGLTVLGAFVAPVFFGSGAGDSKPMLLLLALRSSGWSSCCCGGWARLPSVGDPRPAAWVSWSFIVAAASSHLGIPAAAAAASKASGEGGPPVGAVVEDDDDELFSEATAAIAAAAATAVGFSVNCCSSDGGGGGGVGDGGDRSWARRGFVAVGGVGDNRLPGSGSGLSALRLPPLKLPVSDDGSYKQTKRKIFGQGFVIERELWAGWLFGQMVLYRIHFNTFFLFSDRWSGNQGWVREADDVFAPRRKI